jgi:hypothetical protein
VTFVDGVEFSVWVLDKVRLRSALLHVAERG